MGMNGGFRLVVLGEGPWIAKRVVQIIIYNIQLVSPNKVEHTCELSANARIAVGHRLIT